jgi:hypothetical protein
MGKPLFVYRKEGGVWRADGKQNEDRQVAELVEDHLPDLRARRALEPPKDLGPPLVLKLFREAKSSDVVLELRAWLHNDSVLVNAQRPKVVFEVNNKLLKDLLKLWSE